MKVLFVHDTFFYQDEDNNFYSEHIDNKILERYLNLGSYVTFLGRKSKFLRKKDLTNKFSLLDKRKCSVITLPSIRQRKNYFRNYKIVKEGIKKALKDSDILVPRIPSAFSTIAINYARKMKKPIIAEVIGCTWDAYWNYGIKGKIIAPYFYFAQKKVIKDLPYVIYVTNKFLQTRYPNKGISTNCSNVVIENVEDSILEARLEKINKLKNTEKLKIGTVAGLDVPFKGQKYVIQAIDKLKTKDFKYKLVGNGLGLALREEAEKFDISDKIQIIGPIKHSEIFQFLDELDIYIQPSKQEGLPRALIEAMSRGLPAIGSSTAGIPELLEDKFIFKKGNVTHLTRILKRISKNNMLEQAQLNFNKSKSYTLEVINNRRFKFYFNFLEDNNLPIPSKLNDKINASKSKNLLKY